MIHSGRERAGKHGVDLSDTLFHEHRCPRCAQVWSHRNSDCAYSPDEGSNYWFTVELCPPCENHVMRGLEWEPAQASQEEWDREEEEE